MAFIHKQPVYTEFFKIYNLIFSGLVIKLGKTRFQTLFGLFHLFNGKTFVILCFYFTKSFFDLINLLYDCIFLSFIGKRYFFKLAMSDNNCILISGSNSGTEFLPVCRFKIFFPGRKDVCPRI